MVAGISKHGVGQILAWILEIHAWILEIHARFMLLPLMDKSWTRLSLSIKNANLWVVGTFIFHAPLDKYYFCKLLRMPYAERIFKEINGRLVWALRLCMVACRGVT